jgi:hypothetical protein
MLLRHQLDSVAGQQPLSDDLKRQMFSTFLSLMSLGETPWTRQKKLRDAQTSRPRMVSRLGLWARFKVDAGQREQGPS